MINIRHIGEFPPGAGLFCLVYNISRIRGVFMKELLEKIKFNQDGLVPAIVQDVDSNEVLMLAYMNEESLQKTLKTGKATFWSRSRQELWVKGESSGNYQLVREIKLDCDNDALLLLVEPAGPACHTGEKTCFYRDVTPGVSMVDKPDDIALEERKEDAPTEEELRKAGFLYSLYNLIADRKDNPVEGSYTNYLFAEGVDKICKKIGEEAAEVIIGAKNASRGEMVYEIGDLIYHLLVLLNLYEIPLQDIFTELEKRNK